VGSGFELIAKCKGDASSLVDKDGPQQTSKRQFVKEDEVQGLSSDSCPEESDDSHPDGENAPIDFSDPPMELLPRSDFGGRAAAYVEHFVRYVIGAWRREREINKDFAGFTDIEKAAFSGTGSLEDVEKAITPLLWRLKKGVTLERGEGRWKTRSREARLGMEGKLVKEKGVLMSMDQMATFASEHEYAKAHFTYTKLTFGNKMWNLTHVSHVAACTMKGAREYRRNRDSLNTYDADPVSQRYMHAMKKLVQFTQAKNPNEDMSKNVVL